MMFLYNMASLASLAVNRKKVEFLTFFLFVATINSSKLTGREALESMIGVQNRER